MRKKTHANGGTNVFCLLPIETKVKKMDEKMEEEKNVRELRKNEQYLMRKEKINEFGKRLIFTTNFLSLVAYLAEKKKKEKGNGRKPEQTRRQTNTQTQIHTHTDTHTHTHTHINKHKHLPRH